MASKGIRNGKNEGGSTPPVRFIGFCRGVVAPPLDKRDRIPVVAEAAKELGGFHWFAAFKLQGEQLYPAVRAFGIEVAILDKNGAGRFG